jgi:hypothetical protein
MLLLRCAVCTVFGLLTAVVLGADMVVLLDFIHTDQLSVAPRLLVQARSPPS